MAGLSQADLTKAAGIGLLAVIDAELVNDGSALTRTHAAAIRTAFETIGIEFVQEDGRIGVQRQLNPL